MSPAASSLSIVDIARQMRAASERQGACDRRTVDRSLDEDARNAAKLDRDRALNEVIAWQDSALSRRPQSLADAAAQIGILFDFVSSGIVAVDPGSRPKSAELHAKLEVVERALAGIAVTVTTAAVVDLAEIGEIYLEERVAEYAPSSAAELPGGEP
jgi:hypothetical protein